MVTFDLRFPLRADRADTYRPGHGGGGPQRLLHDARADRVEVPRAAGGAGGPGVPRRRAGRMSAISMTWAVQNWEN